PDGMPNADREILRWPPRARLGSQRRPRDLHPAALEMRLDDRVDDLLALRAVEERTVRRLQIQDLADEMADEIAVVELAPRGGDGGAGGKAVGRQLPLAEFDRIGRGEMQGLGMAELGHQARDRGTLRAIDPDLDAGIVADGDVARLQEPVRAAR